MIKNRSLILILIAALIGLGLSVELCKIYYDANFNPYALGSFCSVSELIDCDGVAKTRFSQCFGIPLSLWGVFFYCFVIMLIFAPNLAKYKFLRFLEVFKNPKAYIFSLSIISFVISMCLASISIFKIGKICVLCFTTYFIDLIMAILAKDFRENIFYEIKQSFIDFKEAIKNKNYLISFIAVVAIFIGFLAYTSISGIFTPQLKRHSFSFSNKQMYVTKDNTMGNINSKVIVHEYIDYNCAACYILNLSIRRIMEEFDEVMVIQHNFPIDKECSPNVEKGHEGSCRMARYALAAKKQGKFWQANEILFEKTPQTEKEIIKLLSKIEGINKKQLIKDANSEEIKKELEEELQTASKQDIGATPTLIINMQKIIGNMPYNELKEKFISAGAIEKSKK